MAAPGLAIGGGGGGAPSGSAGGDLTGSYPNPSVKGTLTTTAVKTTSYTAAAGDLVPVDATSGVVAITLPTAPADKTRIAVKKVDASTNAVTLARGGSDVFNKAGGSTSVSLTYQNQAINLQYASSTSIWYVVAGDIGLTALDTRYGGSVFTVAQLKATAPFVVSHRGGGANIAPEQAIEGMVQAIALGVKMINVDVWQGPDRSLICVHDSTLDRTTTGEGSSENITQMGLASVVVDAGSWFAPGWASNLRLVTLDEVLALCRRHNVTCMIQVKSATNTRPNVMTDVIAKIIQYGMQSATVLVTPNTINFASATAPAAAAGIILGYIAGGATPSLSTLQGYGVSFVTFDITQSAYAVGTGYLAGLAAGGIWLDAWTLQRKSDWTAAVALGALSGTSDDPLYSQGNAPYLTSDPWQAQTFSHGVISSSASRGTFFKTGTPGSLIYWYTIAASCGVLQGWGSRTSNQASIALTQRYESITSDPTRFGYIAFFATDDSSFNDSSSVGNGYLATLRQNGALQIYRRVGATSTQLATLNTTAPTAGQAVPLLISVSGSTITFKRTDTNDTVTATDTTYRGGYWHLGVNDAAVTGVQCSWSGVTLT